MAYVSQEDKKVIAPIIKKILAENGLKGSLRVCNHSTLVLNIKSGSMDFIKNRNTNCKKVAEQRGHEFYEAKGNIDVNVYHVDSAFSGKCRKVLNQLIDALKGADYFDHSDSMTDYFHCSHYVGINIGQYNKSYELVK